MKQINIFMNAHKMISMNIYKYILYELFELPYMIIQTNIFMKKFALTILTFS